MCTLLLAVFEPRVAAQFLIGPRQPSERLTLRPSDEAILESIEARKDLPCTVTPRKAELGFDLRFHSGYEVTLPLKELSGSGEILTVLFRIYSPEAKVVINHLKT